MSQFSLGDTRTLDEVVADLAGRGYLPSFCAGCDEGGGEGAPAEERCLAGALQSFAEYLREDASPETRTIGAALLLARRGGDAGGVDAHAELG